MSSLPSSLSPGTWHGSVMLEVPFTWLQHIAEATPEQAAAVGVGLIPCAWEEAWRAMPCLERWVLGVRLIS